MASYLTQQMDRPISKTTVHNILGRRNLIASQQDEPDSKKKKKASKLMPADQILFEQRLERMIIDAFNLVTITLSLVVSFASTLIEGSPVACFTGQKKSIDGKPKKNVIAATFCIEKAGLESRRRTSRT